MNETEARLVILISQLPPQKRDIFSLTAKLDKSYSSTYNYLRLMEAKGWLNRIKSDKKTFFALKDSELTVKANEILEKGVADEVS